MKATWINMAIGVWLFISAFVWPHAMGERVNTWIVGALIALAAAWALYAPSLRYLNTMFAMWLFISTLMIAHERGATMWHNVIAAVVVFVLSLGAELAPRRRPAHA
jgi:hypothetical protein